MDDVLFSSSTDSWATPQPLFDQISEMFGPFDLDPCASLANKKADRWYDGDIHGDGLTQPWACPSTDDGRANVFVNPPFCRAKKMHVSPWVQKAVDEVQLGRASQVVMLLPARTDTVWWHRLVMPHASVIAFIKGRVQFDGPSARGQSATFPSAIVVFRRAAGWPALKQPPYIATWEQRR